MDKNNTKAHLVERGEEEGLFELWSCVVYVVQQVPCRLHTPDITFISQLSALYGLMCKVHHMSDSEGSMLLSCVYFCYLMCIFFTMCACSLT
jgi:hypothetical protein